MDALKLREQSGLNQTEFWERVGISQSGGSRYETAERNMPKPVVELLRLVYIEGVDLERIKKADIVVVEYMKSKEPELWQVMKNRAKAALKAG